MKIHLYFVVFMIFNYSKYIFQNVLKGIKYNGVPAVLYEGPYRVPGRIRPHFVDAEESVSQRQLCLGR